MLNTTMGAAPSNDKASRLDQCMQTVSSGGSPSSMQRKSHQRFTRDTHYVADFTIKVETQK